MIETHQEDSMKGNNYNISSHFHNLFTYYSNFILKGCFQINQLLLKFIAYTNKSGVQIVRS